MSTPNPEAELDALSATLRDYIDVSRKNPTEVIHKKAYDLNIKLHQGYWAERWKGSKKGAMESKGIAFTQMRHRAKQGWGTMLRPNLHVSGDAPMSYYQRRGKGRNKKRHQVAMSQHHRATWTELSLRQQGIGVLGVAFLQKRWRNSSTGRQLVENKTRAARDLFAGARVWEQGGETGKLLGRATLAANSATIEGFVPGHSKIGGSRSILQIALRNVRQDTETYLVRKQRESFERLAAARGLRLV